MNSSTFSCRSPASSFQTNEFDLLSFAASCRWVKPAAFRAPTTAAMSEAPRNVAVHREEIFEKIREEHADEAQSNARGHRAAGH